MRSLAPNPNAHGRHDWGLVDSMGLPLGRLVQAGRHVRLVDLAGRGYAVATLTVRGKGCMADPAAQARRTLIQVVAPGAPASGTQGFLPVRALDPDRRDGLRAADAVRGQFGGGPGCGPAEPDRGPVLPHANPDVGPVAHARLGNGDLNTVTEYDAKPAFGNVVYLSSNTTEVSSGGITRGMVRVGTPVATVDTFARCDPASDGTLTWHYVSVHVAPRPIYGWIPLRCRRPRSRLG